MTIGKKETGVKLEAVKAYWGTKACRLLTADTGANLAGGDYTEINYIDFEFNEVLGYIWFDDGIAADPAPAGRTLIGTVALGGAETAEEMAAEIQVVADASDFLEAEVDSDDATKVRIQNKVLGAITAETTAGGADLVSVVEREAVGGFLGKTAQGGSTISAESQTFEVKSDQDAENILDDLLLGQAITAEMGLIQVTKERLRAVIGGGVGGNYTPAGGTELTGFGTSKTYSSLADLGGQLILHPIRLDDNDHSADVIMHKCGPLVADINYSGTDQQVLNVSFKAYIDDTVNSAINQLAIGDWTQELA